MDGGHFHGLGVAQVRQESGQPLGQHRLARSGRTRQQQVVGAGGRDLQGTPGLGLAGDIAHVRRLEGNGVGSGVIVRLVGPGFKVQRQILGVSAEVEGEPGQGASSPGRGRRARVRPRPRCRGPPPRPGSRTGPPP